MDEDFEMDPVGEWKPDSLGRHQSRYHDGWRWTARVKDGETESVDEHRLLKGMGGFEFLWHNNWSKLPATVMAAPSNMDVPRKQKDQTIGFTRSGLVGFGRGNSLVAGKLFAAEPFLQIPWSKISAIVVDPYERVNQRLTATRAVVLGQLSIFAQKQTTTSFITLTTSDGDLIVAYAGIDSMDLWTSLTDRVRNKKPELFGNAVGEGPAGSESNIAATDRPVAARLNELDQLLTEGIITEVEHERMRTSILDSL